MATPQVYEVRPELFTRWTRVENAVENSGLDPELVAWCRARAKVMLGVTGVELPPAPSDALASFAEQFWIDVHGITDEQAALVRRELGDGLMVAFIVLLGLSEVNTRTELMVI
jgi:hypothetical protein